MRNIVHSCARYAELARKGLFPCRMGRGSGEINTIIINIAKNIENSVSGMVVRTPTGLSHIGAKLLCCVLSSIMGSMVVLCVHAETRIRNGIGYNSWQLSRKHPGHPGFFHLVPVPHG